MKDVDFDLNCEGVLGKGACEFRNKPLLPQVTVQGTLDATIDWS